MKGPKRYLADEMKNFVILESLLIGRQYSIRAYTEEDAIGKYQRGEGRLIKEEAIDCHMEEVSERDA
jgi:hypothetical protein